MADYRDELRAAHARIAQLERERREAAEPLPPPKPISPVVWVFAALALLMTTFGLGALFLVARSPHPTTFQSSSGSSAPAKETPDIAPPVWQAQPVWHAPLGMVWYPQTGVAPIFADIDIPADGKNEVIGLAWQTGHDDAALNVVALDRETKAVRWHAGPYPAHWQSDRIHLLRNGDRLVVTDAREVMHVLDIRTGKELREPIALNLEVTRVCHGQDGSPRVLVSTGWGPDATSSVDLETGAIAKPTDKTTCDYRHDDEQCPATGPGVGSGMCHLPSDDKVTSQVQKQKDAKSFWTSDVLASGEHRVAIGFGAAATEGAVYAAGFDAKTKKILWTAPMAEGADGVDKHSRTGSRVVLDDDHFYTIYETGAEPMPYRIVARSATTGDVLFTSELAGTAEGSYLSSISVDGDRIFVVMNNALYAFDAKTGGETMRLPYL